MSNIERFLKSRFGVHPDCDLTIKSRDRNGEWINVKVDIDDLLLRFEFKTTEYQKFISK